MNDDVPAGGLGRLQLIFGIPLLLMMLHVCIDVAARFILSRPLPGTLEIVSFHYMVIAVFLPLALVEFTRRSITVDILYVLMPRRVQLILITCVLALTATVYFGLAWRTWGDALGAYGRGDFQMGGRVEVPIWQSRFALPLGFFAAGLVAAWQLFGVVSGRDRESWIDDIGTETTDVE